MWRASAEQAAYGINGDSKDVEQLSVTLYCRPLHCWPVIGLILVS